MGDREELDALRRMAELESRPGAPPAPIAQNVEMSPMQARMGIRGIRHGQGANDLLPNMLGAVGNMGYEAGGLTTDLATKMGASPETAAKFGYGANVATDAVPMFIGGAAGAASKVPEAIGGVSKRLMASALKPNAAEWKSGKAARAVQTMLDEGYNVTKGGVDSMRGRISGLGDEVSSIIKGSGKELDKEALIERLLPNYSKAMSGGSAPQDIAEISKVANNFRNNPAIAGQRTVPIELAQDIKQTMGRELGDASYGLGLKPAAERDAKKALVRAMKEDISKAEPAVAGLNTKEGELINAANIASRRVGMEANTNPLSLALLAHNKEAAIGFIAEKWGLTKSLAARLLYNEKTAIPASAGRAGGAALGAQMGKPKEE